MDPVRRTKGLFKLCEASHNVGKHLIQILHRTDERQIHREQHNHNRHYHIKMFKTPDKDIFFVSCFIPPSCHNIVFCNTFFFYVSVKFPGITISLLQFVLEFSHFSVEISSLFVFYCRFLSLSLALKMINSRPHRLHLFAWQPDFGGTVCGNDDVIFRPAAASSPAAFHSAIDTVIARLRIGEMPARTWCNHKVVFTLHTDTTHGLKQPLTYSALGIVV